MKLNIGKKHKEIHGADRMADKIDRKKSTRLNQAMNREKHFAEKDVITEETFAYYGP